MDSLKTQVTSISAQNVIILANIVKDSVKILASAAMKLLHFSELHLKIFLHSLAFVCLIITKTQPFPRPVKHVTTHVGNAVQVQAKIAQAA